MSGDNSSNFEDVCDTPEAGLATDAYRYTALFFICLTTISIVSGGLLWYTHQDNVYLSRRNPTLVAMSLIPLIGQTLSAPFYRWYLNQTTFFTSCAIGNFGFALTAPAIMIPLCARMMSFHYRAKLNEKLGKINQGTQMSLVTSRELNVETETFELAVTRSFRTNTASEQSAYEDYTVYREVNKLKIKARSMYSIKLAIFLLIFTLISCGIYTLLTCPFPALGLETCEYAFIATPAVAFLLVPIAIPVGIYIYFGQLVKKLPDPFHIRREMRISVILILIGVFTIVLSILEVGSFSKRGEEDLIDFKWEVLLDFFILFGFINAVHVQVYFAIKSSKTLGSIPLSMDQILEHPEGLKVFEAYLQNEFSIENLKAYQTLSHWKVKVSREEWSKKRSDKEARRIFLIWLDPTSEEAVGVNVSYTILQPIAEQIRNDGSNFRSTFFDDIIRELYGLMRNDSFRRFVRSNEYREFVGVQEPELLKDEFWDSIDERSCRCC